MGISYDVFAGSFLSKISEYSFLKLDDGDRTELVDGYMKRAISEFNHICEYDLLSAMSSTERTFTLEIPEKEVTELADIISDGMIVQWLKPYLYHQDILQNVLNTKDFTTYSPAELLLRVGNAYRSAQKDYLQKIREYSYSHGDIGSLHI